MKEQVKNKKYRDILSTAHALFWKHGISRVSIEEICREANVSKMTFYRHFPDKIALAKTILNNMFDENYSKYRELMDSDVSYEEKVRQMLLAKYEGTKDISKELVKDIYTNKRLGLHKLWEKRASEMTKEVVQDFEKAQKEGLIRKDINLDFILYFNNKMTELIYDPKVAAMYETTQDLIMEIANMFFYGIFPRKQNEDE
ncbi:MAG: TetR/AcrR family transcriptional regulator [Bacteroidota bacterium]